MSPETTIAAIPGPNAEPKNEIDEPAATTLPFRSIFANKDSINGIQNDHEKPSIQLVIKKIKQLLESNSIVKADIDNKKPNISGLTKPNLSPNIKIEKAPGIPKRDPTSKAIPI